MKFYNFIIPFLLYSTFAFGQTVSGYIRDIESGNPLPYSNISITGTNRGTSSNTDGFYLLKLNSGKYQLLFQYMGYTSKSIDIQINDQDIKLNIELHPQVLPLDAITVYSNQKSETELLILKASKQKRKSMKYLKNYFCNSYTKTSYRSGVKNVKAYGGIFETYSELYFNRPNKWHEIILSQEQSSNIPKSINMVSGNTFLDINSDRIQIGKKELIGPTAPDAITHYNYEMVDTLYQDANTIFKINFSPKNNNAPSMSGTIYLVDNLFIIKKIDAQLNTECNFDVFENIHIIQNYKTLNDSLLLPDYSFRESHFVIDIPKFPLLIVRKENYRENYILNSDENIIHPDLNAVMFKNSLPFDSVKMHIPPLNKDESQAYLKIDSLVHNNKKILLMTNMLKLLDTYAWIRTQPIGEFSDFFRFNRVEGLFNGLSINTKEYIKPLSCKIGYGYGFSDKKSKYFLSPTIKLQYKNLASSLTLNAYNEIKTRENDQQYPVWLNTYSSIFNDFDYFDYYYAKGYNIHTKLLISRITFSAAYENESHLMAKQHVNHGLFDYNRFIKNPGIVDGKHIGINLNLIYSNIIYQESSLQKKLIPNQSFWEMKFSLQSSMPKLGSDFYFSRYQFILFLRQTIFQKSYLDASFLWGLTHGELPEQFLFELESGFTGYHQYKAFATLNQNVFIGNKKFALFLEHNFHDSIFDLATLSIPWELSIIYNTGWAGDKYFNQVEYNDFYSELGFGLNKIFNLIKCELIWRANKIPNSKSFCFNIKIDEFDIF